MNINKIRFVIFCLICTLIRFPNIYLFFHNPLFQTHTLARGLIILLFISLTQQLLNRFPRITSYIVFYIFAVSLSILTAINITSFLSVYKDFIIGIILFFVAYSLTKKENIRTFCFILLCVAMIMLLFELLFILFPNEIGSVLTLVGNDMYLKFFSYQYMRGRLFGDSFTETLFPFVALFLLRSKNKVVQIILLTIITIVFIITVLFSGWRTKLIIYLFTLIGTFFVLLPRMRITILTVVISLVVLFSVSTAFRLRGNMTSLDRLLGQDIEGQQSQINNSRIVFLKEAIDIGLSSPLIGVGLGNYYEHLSHSSQLAKKSYSSAQMNHSFIIIDDPHNLFFSSFANTGTVGFIALFLLIMQFAIRDIALWRYTAVELKLYMISFWGVFIFAFFNPWMYFQTFSWFWILRGIIEKGHDTLNKKNYEKN